jgi:predicted dehydrogenase
MKNRKLSRRVFLKGASAAVGSALLAPTIVPSSVFGANAPSNRITTAQIGVGGRGSGQLRSFAHPDVSQVVAVCDPFKDRREKNAAYVNQVYKGDVCKPYNDLREMLAREDIEAVGIATPDHWHVPAALLAVRSGRHVYVEKPLGLSVEQDIVLREACRRHGAVFQYGTQQRSQDHVRYGCELVRNGRIGNLLSVEVVSPASGSGGSTDAIPAPEGFDYDLWLGPAPLAPYTRDRCTNQGAYFISEYALGFIAGWGAHPLDVAVWGLGDVPDAVPVEYEGWGSFPSEGLFDTATSWDVRGRLGSGVEFRFRGPGENLTVFTGEKGKVHISRGYLRTEPESLKNEGIGPGELRLCKSVNHTYNFLDCVRSRQQTVNPVEVAVLSDTISQLSDIAIRTGRKIRWDPRQEKIIGDETASRMLKRALRAPWTL